MAAQIDAAQIDQLASVSASPRTLRRARREARHVAARRLRPPVVARERTLATERDLTGAPVVVTTRGLYHGERWAVETAWTRVGWEETARLRWDAPRGVLELTALATAPLHLRLGDATRLVPLIRERVAATLLASARVPLGATCAALVTARRRPGTAEVVWLVVVDGDTDPTDPAAEALIDAAIRDLHGQTGL